MPHCPASQTAKGSLRPPCDSFQSPLLKLPNGSFPLAFFSCPASPPSFLFLCLSLKLPKAAWLLLSVPLSPHLLTVALLLPDFL
ncbi:hypothetical protein ACFX12_034640 [Malus domestica]